MHARIRPHSMSIIKLMKNYTNTLHAFGMFSEVTGKKKLVNVLGFFFT